MKTILITGLAATAAAVLPAPSADLSANQADRHGVLSTLQNADRPALNRRSAVADETSDDVSAPEIRLDQAKRAMLATFILRAAAQAAQSE